MRLGRTLTAAACCLALWFLSGCGSSEAPNGVTASIAGESPEGTPADPAQQPRFEDTRPKAAIRTNLGEIVVELDPKSAPITVENFMGYVSRGYYDQTIVHQVDAGFMLLAGGFDTQYKEKQTAEPIRNEAHRGLKNERGTLAMAREFDVIDSARAQFFINLGDNTSLNHMGDNADQYGYCAFGKVVSGMDVVDKIAQAQVQTRGEFEKTPATPIVIESVKLLK